MKRVPASLTEPVERPQAPSLGSVLGFPVERAPADAPARSVPGRCRADVSARLEELRLEGGDGSSHGLELAGANLIGADLSGLDLSGCDLSGADLSRANLERTVLLRARLVGSVLFQARLDRAELSGADLRGANLQDARAHGCGFGHARLVGASLVGADLSGATLTEADLSNADLRMCRLESVRARAAILRDADLSRANLKQAELVDSDVYGATFDGADLSGAMLRGLLSYERASWIGIDHRDIDFTGAHLCRRFILDQNYLEEFRRRSRWSEIVYHVWWLTSDCGRSLMRWSACTGALALAFAGLYRTVEIDYGDHETFLSPLYYSVVTLTTLGYGDVVPASPGAQAIAMAQVITGYFMLGGLISILSNKLVRRAE